MVTGDGTNMQFVFPQKFFIYDFLRSKMSNLAVSLLKK